MVRDPDRFSDMGNIAQAKISKSVRAELAEVHECLLRELDFSDPIARQIEARMPR